MGVPRLFGYISRTFPKSVFNFAQGSPPPDALVTDYLYLDANSLLHSAAQQIFRYGEHPRLLRAEGEETFSFEDGLPPAVQEERFFGRFFEMILEVVRMTHPRKALVIALDGPAPLAKQTQQRSRRFLAAKSRTEGAFDSNALTPGTRLLTSLEEYLDFAIRREMSRIDSVLFGKGVFLFPPSLPGEGEHKIIDFIRKLPPSERKPEVLHCLFGQDGDLLMLTMATFLPAMFLLRNSLGKSGTYDLMNMSNVSAELAAKTFSWRKETIRDAVSDFIAIGFFVGNDFLPKLRMFLLLDDGLDLMLAVYNSSTVRSPMTVEGALSRKGFLEFLRNVAKSEVSYLTDQLSAPVLDPRFAHTTLLGASRVDAAGKKILDFPAFRTAYYRKAGVDTTKPDEVTKLTLRYLRMFRWVLAYYLTGIPSWEEIYPYHYPPFVVDLVSTIERMTDKEWLTNGTFSLGEPSSKEAQLLSVLPPESAGLLPPGLEPLPSVPISIDFEGVTKEHMGVVLLPFLDFVEIRKKVPVFRPFLRSSDAVYFVDRRMGARYTSRYGVIDSLHCRKALLNGTDGWSYRLLPGLELRIFPGTIGIDLFAGREIVTKWLKGLLPSSPKRIVLINSGLLIPLFLGLLFPDAILLAVESPGPIGNLLRFNAVNAGIRKRLQVVSALSESLIGEVDLSVGSRIEGSSFLRIESEPSADGGRTLRVGKTYLSLHL